MDGSGIAAASSEGTIAAPGAKGTTALDRFSQDLTAKAKAGGMDPILGRDEEIRQIVDVLMRRRQNNPILTGEAGVGKTAVVEGFAQRIAAGDVPPPLRGVKLRVLDVGLMQAGASMKGEFEQRLRSVIDEVQASPTPIILFIDEAHTLIGAGGAAGTGDAANLLKPALARGTLRTIAATTWAEYRQYFEKDPALTRRFQPIHIGEPDVAHRRGDAARPRRSDGEAPQGARHRRSDRRRGEFLQSLHPRAPIARQGGESARHRLRARGDQPERQARRGRGRRGRDRGAGEREASLARERDLGAANEERIAEIDARSPHERERLAALEADWARSASSSRRSWRCARRSPAERRRRRAKQKLPPAGRRRRAERKRRRPRGDLRDKVGELGDIAPDKRMIYAHVDEQAVAAVVSDWTGIPVGKMVADEVETVLHLAEILNRRIVGQSHGLAMIAKRIETNRAKLDNPNKPIGVFMLCGPSGVGKTETALALAETLYGGEQNIITINMSEFQEAHTVSTLKGAPPGYVGYGEGGRLTEAVRRRPYSVILLDEIEKAHPDVHEIFFQVFDKGVMEDGTGRRIDFKNTLILLTSNVGTDVIMRAGESRHAARPGGARRAIAARAAGGLPAGAARAHRHHPLLSAVAGHARRHRAPATRPDRQAHRGATIAPGSSPSRARDRSYRLAVQRSRFGRPRDRQRHHQHDPARAVARNPQALAGARGDPRSESVGGGRRVRLRSELTGHRVARRRRTDEERAMANRFEQVDELVGDAITIVLEQRSDGQWAKVFCPRSAHDSPARGQDERAAGAQGRAVGRRQARQRVEAGDRRARSRRRLEKGMGRALPLAR